MDKKEVHWEEIDSHRNTFSFDQKDAKMLLMFDPDTIKNKNRVLRQSPYSNLLWRFVFAALLSNVKGKNMRLCRRLSFFEKNLLWRCCYRVAVVISSAMLFYLFFLIFSSLDFWTHWSWCRQLVRVSLGGVLWCLSLYEWLCSEFFLNSFCTVRNVA